MGAVKTEDIPKYDTEPKDKAYYENAIGTAIRDYYANKGCKTDADICKESNNGFLAALDYCRRECVSKYDIMDIVPHNTGYRTAHNAEYNFDALNILAEVYVLLCYQFDKVPSVTGYSYLTGVSHDSLQNWGNMVTLSGSFVGEKDKANEKGQIYHYICSSRESAINNRILDNKGTLGGIATLNSKFGWRQPETMPDGTQKSVSMLDIPDLSKLPVFDDRGRDIKRLKG